jgi:hypothetical protein
MLSSNENRQRMRCKLVENLKFDAHFEASRLRDYSGYSDHSAMSASTLKVTAAATGGHTATVDEERDTTTSNVGGREDTHVDLAQKLQMNKEAINTQINEDFIGDGEDFQSMQHHSDGQTSDDKEQQQNQPASSSSSSSSSSSRAGLSALQQDSGVAASIKSDASRRSSITSSATMNSMTSSATTVTASTAVSSTLPTIKINK